MSQARREEDITATIVTQRLAALQRRWPDLSALALTIQAAVESGLASDSRGLAKGLGSEHALVLREIETLAARELLKIVRRDDRTMRTHVVAAGR